MPTHVLEGHLLSPAVRVPFPLSELLLSAATALRLQYYVIITRLPVSYPGSINALAAILNAVSNGRGVFRHGTPVGRTRSHVA